MKKRTKIWLLVVTLFVLIIGLGWGYYMLTTTQCERDLNKIRGPYGGYAIVPHSCM